MIFSNFTEEFEADYFKSPNDATSIGVTYLILTGAFVIALVIILVTCIIKRGNKENENLREVVPSHFPTELNSDRTNHKDDDDKGFASSDQLMVQPGHYFD